MNLWLDDLREPPTKDWTWVKTVEDAKIMFETMPVDTASLDNDLQQVLEGYDLVKWMVETGHWPRISLAVHSGNNVGVKNMCGTIERYGPYVYKEYGRYDGTMYDTIVYTKEV